MSSKKLILILTAVGLLIYFNSLFNGFVWDDEEQILKNDLVHSVLNVPAFFTTSTFNGGGNSTQTGVYYRPVMMTVFSVIYQAAGPKPFLFHLFQIGLHITNAVLVFLIFRAFFKKYPAFFLSLIFLVHPVNTESVVYISALQDTLFLFFSLMALYFTLKGNDKNRSGNLVIVGLTLFLALISKEVAVVTALIILFYRVLFNKKDNLNYLITTSLIVAAYIILRFIVAKIFFIPFKIAPIVQLDLIGRLLMIPAILVHYLGLFVLPLNLAVMQHWVYKQVTIPGFFLPLVIILIFFAVSLIIFMKTKSRVFLFFFLWFLIGIFPYLQIFPLDMTVADRWFYFPIIGLLGLIGVMINMKPALSKYFISGLLVLAFLLSIRTVVRNRDWKNGLTLYSHDIIISRNSYDLENNLGVELYRVKRYREAKIHFERSTQLSPTWWINWNNLGVSYEQLGDLKKYEDCLKKSMDNGDYYLAYENYVMILLKTGRIDEARKFLTEKALPMFPGNPVLRQFYYYLGPPL